MSKQSKAPGPKDRTRHLFGDDRRPLLIHRRQGNIARGRLASVSEWRSRKVHAAGSFINHNRAVTKRHAVISHLSLAGTAFSGELKTLRPFVKGYRKQYSTQIS